jgi:hypothetical protein
MTSMLRFSGAGKRDPIIEEWLNKTDALTAIARTWFKRMRKCGEDVQELMHDGCPVVCVEEALFAYVNVFKTHTNVGFFYGAHLDDPAGLLEGAAAHGKTAALRRASTRQWCDGGDFLRKSEDKRENMEREGARLADLRSTAPARATDTSDSVGSDN